MNCPNQSIQRILRYTQDRPFDASTPLSINPELCRWIDPELVDGSTGSGPLISIGLVPKARGKKPVQNGRISTCCFFGEEMRYERF